MLDITSAIATAISGGIWYPRFSQSQTAMDTMAVASPPFLTLAIGSLIAVLLVI